MKAEKEASKTGQKASREVVVPRDRGTKIAGRPSTDKDPEVLEWAEDMRRRTKDLSNAKGTQLVLERAKASSIIERILKTYTCHETHVNSNIVFTKGLPRYVRIALTSFQGLIQVSPKCPACGVGHLRMAPGA